MKRRAALFAAAVLLPFLVYGEAQAQEPEGTIAEARGLSLKDALARAYERNPRLRAARAASQAASEGLAQARAAYLPRIDLTGAYTAQRIDEDELGVFGRDYDVREELSPNSVGLQVSQELFTGLRRRGRGQQASAEASRAEQSLRATEQSVLLDVVTAFTDLVRDAEIVRVRAQNVEVLRQERHAAQRRFEMGEVTRTDVAQAEARFSAGEAGLAAAEADLARARAALGELLDGPLEAELDAPPAAPSFESLDAALDLAADENPSLAARHFAEQSASAQVRVERAGLLPQISAVGRLERRENATFRGQDGEVESATLEARMPIFEGGFAWSRVRQSRSLVAQARAETDATRLAVAAQVETVWNDLAATKRVILASREQVEAARFALRGARAELAVGQRSTLDVLDAQRDVLDAELALARAERDGIVAGYALAAAIGVLDAGRLGLETPLYDPEAARGDVRWKLIGAKPVTGERD